MKKPTSISISGIKYKIKYELADDSALGLTDSVTNTISLQEYLPIDKLLRVLLHEITHAVIFETPFSMRKRFELEEVCDIVGWHLLSALRDNPGITDYLLQPIEDDDEERTTEEAQASE